MTARFVLVFAGLFFANSVFAASDGAIGTTSTGTSVITVTIPKLIRARSFADFAFGSYAGTGDLNSNDDLNISTNYGTAARTYRLTATGSGVASAFTITDGVSVLPYNAYYNDATGVVGRVALATTVALTTQANAAKPLSTATTNANLSIEILATNLQTVDAGAFTGTLTVVFTPE